MHQDIPLSLATEEAVGPQERQARDPGDGGTEDPHGGEEACCPAVGQAEDVLITSHSCCQYHLPLLRMDGNVLKRSFSKEKFS